MSFPWESIDGQFFWFINLTYSFTNLLVSEALSFVIRMK